MSRLVYIKPIWVVLGTVGFLSATLYPTVIDPYLFPDKWKKRQEEGRATIETKNLYPYDETMNRWKSPWEKNNKD